MAMPVGYRPMEPLDKTRKIIGRTLAFLALLLVAAGFWKHYSSPLLRQLATREDAPIRVVIFTKPAMRLTYNPVSHKAIITLASPRCSVEQKEKCFDGTYDLFFIPKQTVQEDYWTNVKKNLSSWRFNPTLVWDYLHGYINARAQKRTNIGLAEFILLSEELAGLTRADFAIEHYTAPAKNKKKSSRAIDPIVAPDEKPEVILPQSSHNTDQPLVVEVLNASGKKGLALALTQYLRTQNAKNLLRVDVIQYDNYPTIQEKSFIVDYSGKLVQVTQLSHAIGISGEILSEKSTTAICDTRIVLGQDFEIPL